MTHAQSEAAGTREVPAAPARPPEPYDYSKRPAAWRDTPDFDMLARELGDPFTPHTSPANVKPKITSDELEARVRAALATGDPPSATQLHLNLSRTYQIDSTRVQRAWQAQQRNRE
jgi:hypothetical protein